MTSNHKYLLDCMLGSLARWLRICGCDATYRRNAKDEGLIREAKRKGRILLTKDKQLYRKAQKADIDALLVEGKKDVERFGWGHRHICNNSLSRGKDQETPRSWVVKDIGA